MCTSVFSLRLFSFIHSKIPVVLSSLLKALKTKTPESVHPHPPTVVTTRDVEFLFLRSSLPPEKMVAKGVKRFKGGTL